MVNGDTLKPGMESPPPSPSKAVDQIEKLLNTQETWDDSSEDEDKETVKETQDQEYVVLSKSASREDLGDEGGSLYQRLSRTFSDDVDYTHQESLLEEDDLFPLWKYLNKLIRSLKLGYKVLWYCKKVTNTYITMIKNLVR